MKSFKLYASIKDGQLDFSSPEWASKKFNELPDGQYTLTVEKYFGQRTNQQNKYYWGCVIPLVSDGLVNVGYKEFKDSELVHEYLKKEFLTKKIGNENTGEFLEVPGSTKELSTKDFNDFIENVAQWCAEFLGFALPEPSSQSKLFAV